MASFIGTPPMNLVEAEVAMDGLVLPDGSQVAIDMARYGALGTGSKVTFGIRPDDIVSVRHGMEVDTPWLTRRAVLQSEPLRVETLVFFAFAGSTWIAKMLKPRALRPDEVLDLQFNLSRRHLFDRESGKRL